MTKTTYQTVRFAGRGGQGLLSAADLLGRTLALSSDIEVSQSVNYGPESRGGLSYSDLAISNEPIEFPVQEIPTVLVIMSQQALDKFRPILPKIEHIIVDPDMVEMDQLEDVMDKVTPIQSTRIAEAKGVGRSANLVMLGVALHLLKDVPIDLIEKAIADKWPKYAEKNIEAFRAGMQTYEVSRGKN